mgnify:CR=1 FL=1
MIHGGTNFGFTNAGRRGNAQNHSVALLRKTSDYGTYNAIVTSYDYDAPITEAGDPTKKCWTIRELSRPYTGLPDIPIPLPAEKTAYGLVSQLSHN